MDIKQYEVYADDEFKGRFDTMYDANEFIRSLELKNKDSAFVKDVFTNTSINISPENKEPEQGYDESPEEDFINEPSHYTQGGIECIDAIRSALTLEEFRGYIKGNLLKYTWRERFKGGDEDIRKIRKYCDFLLDERDK